MVRKYGKLRPPRLYSDEKGRYIKIKGRKVYIKSQINNKNLVKVIVNNFTRKNRKKRKAMKKIKNKEGEFEDLEEINKSKSGSSQAYQPSTDLAKILFHQVLNKKDEDNKRKEQPQENQLERDQREILNRQQQQLEGNRNQIENYRTQLEYQQRESDRKQRLFEQDVIKRLEVVKREYDLQKVKTEKAESSAKGLEIGAQLAEEEVEQSKKQQAEAEDRASKLRKIDILQNKKNEKLKLQTQMLKKNLELNDKWEKENNEYEKLKNKEKTEKIVERMKELENVLLDNIQSEKGLVDNPNYYGFLIDENLDSIRLIDSEIHQIDKEIELLKKEEPKSPRLTERDFLSPIRSQSEIDRENEEEEGNDYISLTTPGAHALQKIKNDEYAPLRDLVTPIKRPLIPFPQSPQTPQSLIPQSPIQQSPETILPNSPPPAIGDLDIHQNMKDTFQKRIDDLEQRNKNKSTSEEERQKNLLEIDKLKQNIEYHRTQTSIYEKPTQGSGKKDEGGIYNDEIERVMDNYKQKGFKGVYAIDEINKIPVSNKMGVILNLDKSNQKGSHWVALYIDADDDESVEYYDSFAEDPPESLMKDLKELVNKLNPEVYLKFKINKIKQQSENSDSCGIFAMQFLIDRFSGKPFKDCTGYSDVINSERKARKFRKKLKQFGYL